MKETSYHTIIYVLASILFFWLGTRLSGIEYDDDNNYPGSMTGSFKTPSNLLNEQKQVQTFFQLWIRQSQELKNNQDDEACSRTLTIQVGQEQLSSSSSSSSWVGALEHLARALQVALATERRLIVSMEEQSKICTNAQRGSRTSTLGVYCQWQQRTGACSSSSGSGSSSSAQKRQQPQNGPSMGSPARDGIIGNSSDFFNSYFYGPTPDVALPEWPWKKTWLIDTLVWERHGGSFWVRSQILDHLVRQLPTNIDWTNHPSTTSTSSTIAPSVAILIDMDAQHSLQRKFGRNGTKTHAWDRIIGICDCYYAEYYSQQSSSSLQTNSPPTVYSIATRRPQGDDDPVAVPPLLLWKGWKVVQVSDTKNNSDDNGIITILQNLIHAEVLIGSFASPLFRLAASLNFVGHAGTHPLSQRRIWGLDIEWTPDL
jgi:hypothetical protein